MVSPMRRADIFPVVSAVLVAQAPTMALLLWGYLLTSRIPGWLAGFALCMLYAGQLAGLTMWVWMGASAARQLARHRTKMSVVWLVRIVAFPPFAWAYYFLEHRGRTRVR